MTNLSSYQCGIVNENDTVILRFSDNMVPLQVKPFHKYHSHIGMIDHTLIVGKQYGSWIELSKDKVQILPFDSLVWLKCLSHRTQILYEADIALIISELEMCPGQIVIESGTGSGCLSHFIIDTISPNGHLHTFDFHRIRSDLAKLEFENHRLKEFVTVQNRDVLEYGFDPVSHCADAIFIDLPEPAKVIKHCINAIKYTGARFGSFSPCIEQIQKLIKELNKYHATEIKVLECIKQSFDIVRVKLPDKVINASQGRTNSIGHTGQPKDHNLYKLRISMQPRPIQPKHHKTTFGLQNYLSVTKQLKDSKTTSVLTVG
ncbi:hypothetical protein GJ496_009954 [Pomphorhynchus laevis]|nr:hypothetical protein GJ496_009954 [Pomphorhynchus laevis]